MGQYLVEQKGIFTGETAMPRTWKSWTIIEDEINYMPKVLTPIHPGEIIREEVLTPLQISVNQLAMHLAVDAARLNEVVRGQRGVTADTALRLARYLGTTPEFWLKLQVHYELRVARRVAIRHKS